MDALAEIPRPIWRRLAGLNDTRLRRHLCDEDFIPWIGTRKLVALDLVSFLVGRSLADQFGGWTAPRLFARALAYTLPDGIDAEGGHCAVTITGPRAFIVGTGPTCKSALRLVGAGMGHPTFVTPTWPHVRAIREAAADIGVELPERFAPKPGTAPSWAKGDPAWRQRLGIATVELEPAEAGARVAAH